MRRPAFLALAAVLSASGAAGAEVRVTFVAPETYTDASLYNGSGAAGRAPALREIEQTLQRLGAQYLRPQQLLSVDVLDVDLAGRFEPWHFPTDDVRFMREITWPRLKLRYALSEAGRPPVASEETIADQTYLMRTDIRRSSETMPYEKAMLTDWFRTRFAAPQVSAR